MRRLIGLILFLPLWLSCFWGCGDDDVVVGPDGSSINSAINIEIFEAADSGMRSIEFRCFTDSIYNCANFSIGNILDISAVSVKLTFTEIVPPTICLPSQGPASAIVELGSLANGTYSFPITVNNLTVPAQLIVTDSTVEITGGDSTWTDIVRSVLYRVPDSTIWGEIGYNDVLLMDSAKTFLGSLNSIGAVPETLSAGHYGYFFIDSTGAIDSILELGPSMPDTIRIPYIYHYTGDTVALSNLVQTYDAAGNLIEVNVITSDGYEFRSW